MFLHMSMTHLFLKVQKRLWERLVIDTVIELVICCVISRTNDPYSVQLFGLWSSHSWETVTKSVADPLTNKTYNYCLVSGVPLNNCYQVLETVTYPTWVKSTIAAIYQICVVYNVIQMGTL